MSSQLSVLLVVMGGLSVLAWGKEFGLNPPYGPKSGTWAVRIGFRALLRYP